MVFSIHQNIKTKKKKNYICDMSNGQQGHKINHSMIFINLLVLTKIYCGVIAVISK